ncbi:serine hydrolase domain-containing protein [Streptomyces sp. NPDC002812]|uniref:serine hydrolase domain-containing protein n=1 Tax=unclassified Streptomyces TaxID=2593676 RepID=UPI00224FED67|nr:MULTISPECIES: serine hydrolase domain-containing protein [unclassified Streptomyces]MCX5127989.1 beta-lactamase family protein [Streptomyces sp. NBC_00347]MCX5301344.1 beta-lactamase family protein [Streptomyces sp. NBC_00193]
MNDIKGYCEPRFGAVHEALAGLLAKEDVGASAAVYLDGEPVVDLWGGYADADRSVGWEGSTLACVNSTTKNMTALCALILADRGLLDLSAPVAAYWPEFAAAGKEGVLVRHVLSHTAGLPDLPGLGSVAELYDWEAVTAGLAAQAPAWEPGTAAGYHALTFGFLVGEIVRRITGRGVGAFFAEEVAGPLGADFHIGLPAEHDHRVAPLIPPPSLTDAYAASAPPGPDGAPRETTGVAVRVRDVNAPAWRRAQIPAVNGYGNARSVALVQSVLANRGTAGGVRLLSARGCEPAWQEVFSGADRVLGTPMAWTAGFGKFGNTFGWGGWGGSLVVSDPEARMTVAYVMNQMIDRERQQDDRGMEIVMAAYGGLH